MSRFLAEPLRETVAAVAEHLVIGVDLRAPDNHGRPYGETALVVRTRDGRVVGWTGKSFPTSQQQGHLIRNGEAANHLMNKVWFSIFLVWLVKLAVMKYGGPALYRRTRPLFLGLIMGQFVVAGVWLIIDNFTGMTDNVVFWI